MPHAGAEIVYPFVRANFPRRPLGLMRDWGRFTNIAASAMVTSWAASTRLPGLQRAIKAGTVPSFKELTGTTEQEFYGEDKGTNYSQARYLCYYLQEQGKLRSFYRDFVVNQKDDPTGYKTLVKTLGEDDMAAFQKRWEAFVMKLKYR